MDKVISQFKKDKAIKMALLIVFLIFHDTINYDIISV